MGNDSLDDYRKAIDAIDDKLIKLLAERTEVVKKVGEAKAKLNLPPLDEKRKQKVLENWQQKAKAHNLSTDLIKQIYETIHDHAVNLQKNNQRK
jgi:chorismate mutase